MPLIFFQFRVLCVSNLLHAEAAEHLWEACYIILLRMHLHMPLLRYRQINPISKVVT